MQENEFTWLSSRRQVVCRAHHRDVGKVSSGQQDEQKQTEIVSGPVKEKTMYSHVGRWELECMSVHDPEVVVIECESQLWRSNLGKILLVQLRVYRTPVQPRSNLNRPLVPSECPIVPMVNPLSNWDL